MKKFYVLIVACFSLLAQGFAQDYTWVGGASGNWNVATNWSPNGVPQQATENVIFNGSASVSLDIDVTLNSLNVSGNGNNVKIVSAGDSRTMTLASTSTVTPALKINATNTLRFTSEAALDLIVYFGDNAKGNIDGILSLGGFNDVNKAVLFVGENEGLTTKVNINNGAKIIVEANGLSPINSVESYLSFNAGSKLELKNNGPSIPVADFAVSSEIIVSGITNQGMAMVANGQVLGNLTYNCPGQQAGEFEPITLNFGTGVTIGGDLKIESTNNNPLILIGNNLPFFGQTARELTVKGDLNIQGTSKVIIADDKNNDLPYKMTVEGDVVAAGSILSLQNRSTTNVQPTTLIVKGDILHTNGSFTQGSTTVNETNSLFIIEMKGSTAQTISSSQNTFDNGTKQLTLKINNTGPGVTLQSPLVVGRLNLTAGKISTNTSNYLTLSNTSEQPIVLSSTANSFVEGPLRRMVATTNEVTFATGSGTVKRSITIKPSSNTATTFEAEYVNSSNGSTSFAAPLEGIEQNYYWKVNRTSGSANAKIKLTLTNAIAGADGGDAIVVAKFASPNWVRARGTDGTYIIGDQTSGDAISEEQTSFGSYTFGYGVQASVLPIKLESFTAKQVNSAAQLNWRISENSNAVSFEVMKSGDGINFSKIGVVTALDGKFSYDFTDNSLHAGNNYYRLRMLDKDGVVSFSNIIAIMNGTKGVMISSMIPTMVIDRARLNITSSIKGNMQLVVTDISGRVIQMQNASITAGNQEIWLNASRLSPGIYQVTGYINGEKTETTRFFKR